LLGCAFHNPETVIISLPVAMSANNPVIGSFEQSLDFAVITILRPQEAISAIVATGRQQPSAVREWVDRSSGRVICK
jgi:hypothetical protein